MCRFHENQATIADFIVRQDKSMGCFIKDKKFKSRKGHNSEKIHFELFPLKLWTALWIVYTYCKFQVNIFSNDRGITKCQSLHDNANAKTTAIPWVSSKNSKAKKINRCTHTCTGRQWKPHCDLSFAG